VSKQKGKVKNRKKTKNRQKEKVEDASEEAEEVETYTSDISSSANISRTADKIETVDDYQQNVEIDPVALEGALHVLLNRSLETWRLTQNFPYQMRDFLENIHGAIVNLQEEQSFNGLLNLFNSGENALAFHIDNDNPELIKASILQPNGDKLNIVEEAQLRIDYNRYMDDNSPESKNILMNRMKEIGQHILKRYNKRNPKLKTHKQKIQIIDDY